MQTTPPTGLPLIGPDQEAPGRWITQDGVDRWVGEVHWLVPSGDSLLLSAFGRIVSGWGVPLPDGRTGTIELVGAECWRLWLPKGAVLGTMSFTENGCLVLPAEMPRFAPVGRFEVDLWGNVDFRAMLRRTAFIGAAWRYLSDHVFRPDDSDRGRLRFTAGEASAMLARMRGWGDAAMDMERDIFAFEPRHTIIFEEVLEDIGWHALTPEEYAIDHARALRLLDEVEVAVHDTVPASSRPGVIHLRTIDRDDAHRGPMARMRRAMDSGRCTIEQYDRFVDLLDVTDERLLADLDAIRRT